MIRTCTINILGVMLLAATSVSAQKPSDNFPEVRLCIALEEIQPGQKIPVEVTGIYKSSTSLFYDPEEPTCPSDVQPSTLLVLPSKLPSGVEAILKRDGRVMLTVRGTLWGLPPESSSPKSYPVAGRIGKHMSAFYGFQHDFRTKLVVESVLSYEEVPRDFPWGGVIVRPRNPGKVPRVLRYDIPRYPGHARRLGVEGLVVVRIKVSEGKVVQTEVLFSDDPILARAAKENVSTWEFPGHTSTEVETVFRYTLERRPYGCDDNPRVESRLPLYVHVVGPTLEW